MRSITATLVQRSLAATLAPQRVLTATLVQRTITAVLASP